MGGWRQVEFATLEGWHDDDHQAALACFRMSARAIAENLPVSREAVEPPEALREVAAAALALDMQGLGSDPARIFFEKHFMPMHLDSDSGFVTAYFEPVVEASRTRTERFSYPLYRRPPDLHKIDRNNPPEGVPDGLEYARKTAGGYEEFPDREAIDKGALDGLGLELFWLKSAIDGFYIHIQGSARLALTDGSSVRVSYAGKTGHPYTSIGKVLVARGAFTVEQANMENIRTWLEADEARAMQLLHQNRSFIFFAEVAGQDPEFGPVAAAGVQLTPGRSLAIDKTVHAYGTPVWLDTEKPLPSHKAPFRRLMIAQDTGSAIVGAKRGDIFMGSGDEAGLVAGSVRHDTGFVVFKARKG